MSLEGRVFFVRAVHGVSGRGAGRSVMDMALIQALIRKANQIGLKGHRVDQWIPAQSATDNSDGSWVLCPILSKNATDA